MTRIERLGTLVAVVCSHIPCTIRTNHLTFSPVMNPIDSIEDSRCSASYKLSTANHLRHTKITDTTLQPYYDETYDHIE
jgi:hypothetical protein